MQVSRLHGHHFESVTAYELVGWKRREGAPLRTSFSTVQSNDVGSGKRFQELAERSSKTGEECWARLWRRCYHRGSAGDTIYIGLDLLDQTFQV